MSKSKKMTVPVLEDVVVLGKELTESATFSPALDELHTQALQQQIEKIVQSQLDDVLNKVSQQVTKEIKAYLDKELPKLVEAAKRSL